MHDPGSSPATDSAHEEPPRDEAAAASVAGRRSRRARWRLWLSLLAAFLVLRLAFSMVLGPLLEDRLSRVFGTVVEIGDVSFAPIDAVFTLRSVTVQAPGASSSDPATPPAIAAARVRIDVQWLPLLHRALLVREVAFESASIDLERLTRGEGSSLERVVRLDPAAELPSAWTFALDRIVLRDTQVRLGGLGGKDPAVLEVGVRDAQVSTLRRRVSAFGRAPNLRVDAVVEGGRIRIDGSSDLEEQGVVIDALVRAKDVPIARLNPYLEGLGWSVAGRLSGQLHYQRDPGRRDLVTGRLRLRRVAVQVPALDAPALAVRRAEVEVDAIDLRQHRVGVGALTLHGARLALRPDLAAPIPLLDGISFAPAAVSKTRRPMPSHAAAAAPWSWTIGHVTTPFAQLHVAGDDGGVVLAASMSGESIGPGAYWSPLRAWVGRGGGVAVFDGTARMTRGLTIEGRLTAGDVDVPAFARAFGMPLAELAQAGRGTADLTVEIEPGAAKDPVDVRGKIGVSDLWLAGPEADAFALGAGAVQLTLAAIAPPGSDPRNPASAVVRISEAAVSSPYALFTRTPDGWIVPPFAPEATAAGAEPLEAVAEAPVPTATAPAVLAAAAHDAAEQQAPEVPPAAVVIVGAVHSHGGRVLLVDRATEPPDAFDVALLEGWAQDVRLPAATLGTFVVQGSDPRHGTIALGGARAPDRRELELSAQAVPLAAATPYLEQAGLPYRFTAGTGSFLSRITFTGGRWSADTNVRLHEPRLAGGDAELRAALGMPVEVALAALRDADGDVMFQLPLASPGDAGARPLADMVAGAVRDAVVRARQAPLPDAPIQIAFAPGRAELGAQGPRQIAMVADLLAARRDVVVELSGATSSEDRRWLAEQALSGEIDEPRGFMGVLRVLGVRDQRERIRNALTARGEGKPGRLDEDDEEALAELVADAPPVAQDRLVALAAARLTRVASMLADQYGVAPARVVVAQAQAGDSPAPPVVRARISVDPRSFGLTARREVARP